VKGIEGFREWQFDKVLVVCDVRPHYESYPEAKTREMGKISFKIIYSLI